MPPLTKDASRPIIDHFAKEIAERKRPGPRPQTHVIDFRTEKKEGFERPVVLVPLELLRFRKDNGRIASDVMSYERLYGVLDETTDDGQTKLKDFLFKKDPEKTDDLKKSIMQLEQTDPAIITCDGFLINGNRRKMVMELLGISDMKVVILPGKGEPGGPPTIKEIEQIENRYQMQRDTKAEYSGLDKALSMRRKMECGITLKELLRDDPVNAGLTDKELDKEVKNYEEEFLEPLKCVDRYLSKLGMDEQYSLISEGLADREGRWQAFKDYYKSVAKKLADKKEVLDLGISDFERGKIEDVAFKIIRKRDFPEVAKAHKIMRDLPKLIKNKDAKKHLFELTNIEFDLPEETKTEGTLENPKDAERKWASKHHQTFMHRVRTAFNILQHKKERETAITLIEGAIKKLEHEDMNPEQTNQLECAKAVKLLEELERKAKDLRAEFFHLDKKLRKLTNKEDVDD